MSNVSHPLGGKTTVAIGVMLAALAVPYTTTRLARLRVVKAPWDQTIAEATPQIAVPPPVATQGELVLKPAVNEATVTNALPDQAQPLDAKALAKTKGSIAIEDATNHAMDNFYARLAKTKAKQDKTITRILHYGDSMLVSDMVAGTMRRKMQADFGDSGHGFILVANAWDWYFHNDVGHGSGEGWRSSRVTGPLTPDGKYGLGGVSFIGSPGASAWFSTTVSDKSTYGKKVSRFDVYYLETPNGGDVELKAGDKTEKLSTKGDSKSSKSFSLAVPDGENKMTMRVTAGNPRLFGVILEREGPGVVYDSLGQNGGRTEHYAAVDAAHWKEQLDLRDPSLIVLQFGTNESEIGIVMPTYEPTLRSVIDKLKAAAPKSSILVVAPLDRAEKMENGGMRTRGVIKKLVEAQKKVANEAGVAFWNTYEAMGGEGTMATWVRKGLAGSDLTHPSHEGASIIGNLLYSAVISGYEAWASAQPNR